MGAEASPCLNEKISLQDATLHALPSHEKWAEISISKTYRCIVKPMDPAGLPSLSKQQG